MYLSNSNSQSHSQSYSQFTTTENGALSLTTTGSSRVNFFFKVLRGLTQDNLNKLFDEACNENFDDGLKLMVHLRDARGGKGEREQFIRCINRLCETGNTDIVLGLMGWIPYYGRWKDLLQLISIGGEVENKVYDMFAKMLLSDKQRYLENKSISLCAKWAPSENCEYDKKFKAAHKIAQKMGITMKTYRREYLSVLRTYCNTTEVWMCSNKWDEIPYEKVASRCMLQNRKVFMKHAPETFEKYLHSVNEGEKKINASQLFPHTICQEYINDAKINPEIDQTLELQWKSLVNHVKSQLNSSLGKSLAICDVSGSMSGVPLQVCISLGLLIAELADDPFKDQVLTFHENPQFVNVGIGTHSLRDKVKIMKAMPWGGSTNFQASFDLILDKCRKYNLSQSQIPETLYVFSDMQFNDATGENSCYGYSKRSPTNFEAIKAKYKQYGYVPPKIVFWNLRANTVDFPTSSNEHDVALVSGFSPVLLKLFMNGESLNPYNIMRTAIDDKRYEPISCENLRSQYNNNDNVNRIYYSK